MALTGLEAGFAGGLRARDSGSLMGLQVSKNFGRGLPFTPAGPFCHKPGPSRCHRQPFRGCSTHTHRSHRAPETSGSRPAGQRHRGDDLAPFLQVDFQHHTSLTEMGFFKPPRSRSEAGAAHGCRVAIDCEDCFLREDFGGLGLLGPRTAHAGGIFGSIRSSGLLWPSLGWRLALQEC